MASQSPNNPNNAWQVENQAQMRRDDFVNQPSDIHNQGQPTNFLQETGTQAKSVAQGAVNLARGAAAGAANMAQGAAAGAVNMAQGAAGAVKTTLGINAPNSADHTTTTTTTTTAVTNQPGTTASIGGSTNPNNPNARI